MRIIHRLDEMTETARGWLSSGPVGFVATSGGLHAGHLSLVQAAQRECEITVVSIVTSHESAPTRYQGAGLMYDLERDVRLLEAAQVDIVFIPRPEDIYPPTLATYVTASTSLVERLDCFLFEERVRSVPTIFTRLLQLIRPDIAYFGQKSIRQVALMRHLIHDLCIDSSVRVLPMVREGDGLALSNNNAFLTPEERQVAPLLYHALLKAKALIEQGERQIASLKQAISDIISASPLLSLDCTIICDSATFESFECLPGLASLPATSGILLTVIARVGSTRLTDNIQFTGSGYWLM